MNVVIWQKTVFLIYIARCVVTCTVYHILQICSQSNALLWLLQHWGQKLSKSYTSSCCKSKFMSSNIFYFIFSSVRYMQLAVKQFPSTVIILSISLLFSGFNECNILYCTSTCLTYLIQLISRKNPTKKWIKKHLLDIPTYHSGGYPVAWSL